LYATCKRLESGAADIIAIPCNTAHAYVERIQPYLEIPIVNMLSVTAEHLRSAFPALREVGVLATTGTLASGVYEQELARHGLQQIAPSAAHCLACASRVRPALPPDRNERSLRLHDRTERNGRRERQNELEHAALRPHHRADDA